MPSVPAEFFIMISNKFLSTFPLHSGLLILELIAKNVPVVAKNDEGIDGYRKQRLQELLCTSKEQLVDL